MMDNFNQQPYPPAPQPTTPIINPPPEQPPSPNRSWLKWVVLVVLVTLLSSGGTYFVLNQTKKQPPPTPAIVQTPSPTPTPDPTANWKTYTDINEGFLFKYPEERYLLDTRRTEETTNESQHTSVNIQYCPTKKPEDCAFPSYDFQVGVYENPQNMSIDFWLKTTPRSSVYQQAGKQEDRGKRYCYFNDPRTVQNNKNFLGYTSTTYDFVIDQETADSVCKGVPLEGGGLYKYIFVAKGEKIYWISRVLSVEDAYPEPNQILSTFKFTQ